MAIRLGKRQIITLSVIAVLAIAVGLVVWSFSHPFETENNRDSDRAPITTNTQPEETPDPAESEAEAPKEADSSALDPATVTSVPIEQLGVSVSYVKGLSGGFSYAINRSPEGTQYAALSSEQLAGTKCTDDTGVFATIVKNPQSIEDKATLASTKTVDGTLYGLSLPSATCTGDAALFAQYQTAFKDAFGLLQSL